MINLRKKVSVRDSVIQKRYYCDHVRKGERIAAVAADGASLVHLCRQCCDSDYELTVDGKIIITQGRLR